MKFLSLLNTGGRMGQPNGKNAYVFSEEEKKIIKEFYYQKRVGLEAVAQELRDENGKSVPTCHQVAHFMRTNGWPRRSPIEASEARRGVKGKTYAKKNSFSYVDNKAPRYILEKFARE
jgi:hypothetical protein